MGRFYTNVTLKGPSREDVIEVLSWPRPRWALVSPSYGDLTVIYDKSSERQDGSAYRFVKPLSKELDCLALYVMNHDDSVLHYRLYRAGKVIDNYDSCPNYFKGKPVPPAGGNATVLCDSFGVQSAVKRVHKILHCDRLAKSMKAKDRYVFEVSRHADLVDALGLPAVAVGFGFDTIARSGPPKGIANDEIELIMGDSDE